MAAPSGKRILKWTARFLPWLLAISFAAGWLLSAWTPDYLEKKIPLLAQNMGIPLDEFHIRDAGLFSADIGPVRIGPQQGGIRLANVHVTYTPTSLRAGRLKTLTIEGITLDCEYDGSSWTLPGLEALAAPSTGNSANTLPIIPIDIIKVTDGQIHCQLPGQSLSIPFTATVTPSEIIAFDISLTPRDQAIAITGTVGPTPAILRANIAAHSFNPAPLSDILPIAVNGLADINIDLTVDPTDITTLQSTVAATIRQATIPATALVIDHDSPIKIAASIADQRVTFSLAPVTITLPHPVTVSIPTGYATADNVSFDFVTQIMGTTIPGSLTARRENHSWAVKFSASQSKNITMHVSERNIQLDGINLEAQGTIGRQAADIILSGSTQAIKLEGLAGRTGPAYFSIPLTWPAPVQNSMGSLSVADIHFEHHDIGSYSAWLRQEKLEVAMKGTLHSQILPTLDIAVSGRSSINANTANITFDVTHYNVPESFDPARLVPSLKSAKAAGILTIEGGVTVQHGVIKSWMDVFITDGYLTYGENGNTTLNGIRLYFESPDLLNFHSSPAQLLSFDSLQVGPIHLGQGTVTFQLEPQGVILVERLSFDWAGGHVASRAFRIVPGHDDYDVTLFCSNLRLSDLLEQLGLAQADGEAALSGELPVTWKHGKITFKNGFLHSTPGEGGIIQIEAMEDLVASIPEGTPQRGQLELAKEAIRDFEYKWVRIKADSVGDDLLVRLSVDGKPAKTLPFIYRKEFGGFARVTGDVQGSNFQGLRLDVNFTLPLDRILLYKDIINMIE